MSEYVYNYEIHKNRHISISASAGTGKTYTITKIIEQFVQNKISLDKIAVITYTEKAAQELKKRIQTTLSSIYKKDKNELIKQISSIQIGTIHHFCRNILKNHTINLSYSYQYQEIRDEDSILEKNFRDFWERIEFKYQNELYETLQYVNYNQFKDFILLFTKKIRNHEIEKIISKGKKELIQNFNQVYEFYQSLENDLKNNQKDRLYKFKKERENEKFNINEVKKSFDKIFKTSSLELYKSYFKKNKNEQELFLQEKLKNLQKDINHYFFSKIIFFQNLFIKFYYKNLKENDILLTSDLILETKKLFSKKPEITNLFSKKYLYTIIDECQDTNLEQIDIFASLYKDKKKGIIMVGDAKQSIYRFQGADLNSYKNAEQIFQVQTLTLNQTYRSRKSLTNSINFLTKEIFQDDERIKFETIQSQRDEEQIENSCPVQFIDCNCYQEKEELNSEEKKNIQIKGIIEWITKSVHNSEYKIFDKIKNQWREIQFQDIVILTPTNQSQLIKNYFVQANIPFSISNDKNFLTEPIIKPILHLLVSIESPYNTEDLILCLESVLFNISREEISKIEVSYLEKVNHINIQKIYQVLYRAYHKKNNTQIGNLLYDVLKETEALTYLSFGVYGSKNTDNIRKMIEYLNHQQMKHSLSFGEVVRKLKQDIKDEKEIELRTYIKEEEVQCMTCHKSKGLEFPVVIVYNLELKNTKITDIFLRKKKEKYEIDFKYKKDKTDFFDQESEIEKKELLLEKIRLFYVTITRARDFLVIPGYTKEKDFYIFSNKFSMSYYLENALQKIQNILVEKKYAEIFTCNQTGKLENKNLDKNEIKEKNPTLSLDTNKTWNQPKIKIESYSSLKSIPSEINSTFEKKRYEKNLIDQLQKNQAATFGTICHNTIEKITQQELQSNETVLSFLNQKIPTFFEQYQLLETEDYSVQDAINLCNIALTQSYLLNEKETFMKEWNFFYREHFFMTFQSQKTADYLKGYIDGIFLYNEKYYIIDWKTDNLKEWEKFEMYTEQQYKIQYMLYSFALLEALVDKIENKKEKKLFWEKKFGGFLYVYLRKKIKPNYIIKKPNYNEILSYINQILSEV